MKVTIPDPVLEKYHAMADAQGRPIEAILADQLDRFADHAPGAGRCYVFSGPLLDRLEKALGNSLTRSARDLCARAEGLAALSFGHIRLDFSTGQLTEIDYMAKRQGISPRELATRIIRQIEGQFFHHLGGAADVRHAPAPAPKAGASNAGA